MRSKLKSNCFDMLSRDQVIWCLIVSLMFPNAYSIVKEVRFKSLFNLGPVFNSFYSLLHFNKFTFCIDSVELICNVAILVHKEIKEDTLDAPILFLAVHYQFQFLASLLYNNLLYITGLIMIKVVLDVGNKLVVSGLPPVAPNDTHQLVKHHEE